MGLCLRLVTGAVFFFLHILLKFVMQLGIDCVCCLESCEIVMHVFFATKYFSSDEGMVCLPFISTDSFLLQRRL